MNIVFLITIITILIFPVFALDPYVKQSISPNSQVKILMIGDSITVSNCNQKSNGLCGWRKFLASKCNKTSDQYSIDTLAKVGITAQTVSNSFPNSYAKIPTPFIKTTKYNTVFVALGINDIGDGKSPTTNLQKSYNRILEKLLVLNPKQIYFILPFPYCRYGSLRPKVATRIAEIRQYLLEKFNTLENTETQVNLIDIYQDLVEEKEISGKKLECLRSDLESSDHLHPKNNDTTQEIIADAIVDQILSVSENAIACNKDLL